MGVPASRRALGKAFRSITREHGFEPLALEGRLPDALVGTLTKNGPGLFESHGTPYRHWLDGDGAVTAVRFRGGHAEGAVRVIATPELEEERRAGRMLYGSGYTVGPSWRRRLFGRQKNPTNIHTLHWQGRLFAMTEMGRPIELDPETLRTIGPTDLGGVAPHGINAHVRVHPRTGEIYAAAPIVGVRNALDVVALPTVGPARRLVRVPLRSPPLLVHDFALSERHLVFVAPPVRVRLAPLLAGVGSPMDAISYHAEEGTRIIVVPLDAPDTAVVIEVPEFFKFHDANAFEPGDGTIAVDVCRYPSFFLGDAFLLDALRSGEGWLSAPEARLDRLTIDPARKTARLETIWAANCDFPSTHPERQGRRARFLWALVTRDHAERVVKLDLETGEERTAELLPHEHPGEPTFVARPGGAEDDGWILTIAFDSRTETSVVVVLDARSLGEPIARARFDHAVAFPLHGGFAPAAAS